VVSVLPPAETGIANYTLRTFEASPVPVDVFAPLDGAAADLAASRRLPAPGGPLAVFALEAFSAALALRDYAAVVWVLGNSTHHLPVIRLLRETRHLPPLAPTWVQLHDPMLFNLARLHAEEMDSDLATLLRGVLRGDLPGAEWKLVARGDIRSVIDHPGLPLRVLLAGVPLHGVIFHSRAARDLVRPDWPELEGLAQLLLYLPVMEPFRPRPWTPGPAPRLGTFGYPAASKGSDLVIEAFRRLRATRPAARLVIAGYNAARYAAEARPRRGDGRRGARQPPPCPGWSS
jgi:glycosyltransferase involved in cell wall biosynthesis